MEAWNRERYEIALASGAETDLQRAYNAASQRAWDMRYRPGTRAVAREYLPKLTAALSCHLRDTVLGE